MGNKFSAIAANTFLETIRQPIYGILMWTAAVWIAVFGPTLSAFTLEAGGDTKMLIDNCLATLLLYGLLASVFSATSVITREIESYTVLTVVSKPVSRPTFFLAKYVGVAGAMLLAYYFLSLVVVMAVRHGVMERASDKLDLPVLTLGISAVAVSLIAAVFCNYFYGHNFWTTMMAWVVPLGTVALGVTLFFDEEWNSQSPLTFFGYKESIAPAALYAAILLNFMAVMILTAFAITLSTRFSQVTTLVLCSGVFLLGLLSDYYFGSSQGQDNLLGRVLYHVLPNFQFFWLGDAITQELGIQASHVARVTGYALLYTLAVLSLGLALFQTREVG